MKTVRIIIELFLSAFFIISCNPRDNRIEGVPFTNSYNDCIASGYDFGEIITIGDPNDRFMVSLPYEWDIQESYTDTLYGMIATNTIETEENPRSFVLFSVTGYKTEDSLSAYFIRELKSLKKDRGTRVLEAGEILLKENKSYWVKFQSTENEDKFMNLVIYAKLPNNSEVYLIHSCVFDIEGSGDRLCALKRLAGSFEFVIH